MNDIESLERQRAALALDVREGRAEPKVLDDIELELARYRLAQERDRLAEDAAAERVRAEAEHAKQLERERKAKRLKTLARMRVKKADEVEQASDALVNALIDYFASGDEAAQLCADLGLYADYYRKADQVAGFLFWKLGAVRPIRRFLDMTAAHEHYRQPLSAIESSWAPEVTT